MDYNGTNQSLLFRAGEKCVAIGILDDLKVERTEWFNTYLAIATTTAKVLHGCGHINIYDNDGELSAAFINILSVLISNFSNKYLKWSA